MNFNNSNDLIELLDLSNNINILYPDVQVNKINYDCITTGFFNNISFIGMNFQSNDKYLKEYNKIFTKYAILNKTTALKELCLGEMYKNATTCKKIVSN